MRSVLLEASSLVTLHECGRGGVGLDTACAGNEDGRANVLSAGVIGEIVGENSAGKLRWGHALVPFEIVADTVAVSVGDARLDTSWDVANVEWHASAIRVAIALVDG